MKGWLSVLFASAVMASPPARFVALDTILYRGAAPLHEEEFRFLAKLGVKTVISVDRSRPNRVAAESLGLRYVHIPIGYGKVDRTSALDFLKAIETLKGPFYVHCHAGKYRAGAMSAFYRISKSGWDNESALKEMLSLGGKDTYMGLNYSVLAFHAPTRKEIDAHPFDPDKPREIPELAEQMSSISHLFQELEKLIQTRRDTLEMEAASLAIEEGFWEIDRLELCPACDSTGYAAMRESARHAQEMRLRKEYSRRRFDVLTSDCRSCHLKMRDLVDNAETAIKMKLEKLRMDWE